MTTRALLRRFGVLALAVLAACDDDPVSPTPGPTSGGMAEVAATDFGVPSLASVADLVTRDIAGTDVTFWPYTGRTPTLGDAADPINLILVGDADPRVVRERLMALSGDRTPFGLPPVAPFNCTWGDAIGGTQSVYTESFGWSGSVVQLQCGNYEDLRIHVRLFRAGDVTLAGVHLDVRIPGTTDHDVVAWELARALTALDLQRFGSTVAGLAVGITESPTFRSVLPPVFAGLPGAFKDLLITPPPGLPASLTPAGDLLNDGNAVVFALPALPTNGSEGATISRQTVDIDFDQIIPRPFCDGGGTEYLQVRGPVTLTQQVTATPSGTFMARYHARGHLDVQIVAPVPSEPYRALVNQHGRGVMTDQVEMVNDVQLRMEVRPGGGERGQLRLDIRLGPDGAGAVSGSATCKG